ncbi:hypothetical protein C490_13815 [Natronobacterium gregoryi SP2]|nr:hypothetical protein C490_13815 [Natronobacterium gregoryi SP2]
MHQYVVPRDTTMFLWVALAVGTPERIPQIQSPQGSRLFTKGVQAQEQMTWSVSIDDESVPLIADSHYRKGEYRGLAWWIAIDPIELPATVCVEFETIGDQPTVQGDPVVLWTEQGDVVSWGTTIESTIKLNPSDSPANSFPTHRESLWDQHMVYRPLNSME